MKVAINSCYGGFGLSPLAVCTVAARKGVQLTVENTDKVFPTFRDSEGNRFSDYSLYEDRTDPDLIAVIEILGADAAGPFSKPRIIEIPDDVQWEITEYDGIETIEEVHRSWS